ncbi:MAG: glycosyltransferase family 4 protein [Planctomycetota bacterium]|jgi:glycosyltransferase involved in cell wall biosynthesis
MKIAFLVVKNIARGGGIEKYTWELGRRLVARGNEVTVYSMKHYHDEPKESNGIRVIKVPFLPFRTTEKITASASAAFYSFLASKPDIVHFHSVAAGTFAWMLRLRKLACVLQMHGLEWKRCRWGRIGSSALRFLEHSSLKQATVCTAVSKVQCDFIKARYGIDMKYIPTGTDIREKRPPREIYKLGLEPKQYILFASRLVREKGAQYLVRAFRKLDTDIKLVIAGDAPGEGKFKKELFQLADNDKRILFPGWVQGRLLDELFSHALVYVQPSVVEGLSISLLEAMSYDNPCLVSDIPENLEAVGDAGFVFRNRDVDSLYEKLKWILENRHEATAVGFKGRERVRKYYSWDNITDEFEQLYMDVLNGNGG